MNFAYLETGLIPFIVLVPVHYLSGLVDFAEARGAPRGAILRSVGLQRHVLEDSDAQIPSEQFLALIETSIDLSGDPALLLRLGSELRVTSHGILGYAAMSSATLAEALSLAAKYVQTRSPLLVAEVMVEGRTAVLRIEEAAVLGDARHGVYELVVGALNSVATFLVGDRFRIRKLLLPYEEPAGVDAYRPLLDCPVEFGADGAEIHFDASLLDLPLPLADEGAKREAARRCEEELAAIERSDDIVQRVRARLLKSKAGMPTLDEAARQLAVSPRTLRRRLHAEDTSYRQLLTGVRHELAVQYLRTTKLPVYEIADRLGYGDQSNFGRAFKVWSGLSPQEFRGAG